MYRDREKPGRWLGLENCPEGQRIFQLKSETCSTTSIRSIGSSTGIGSPTDIERSIDINNISRNKETDHLSCRDFEEVDYLF